MRARKFLGIGAVAGIAALILYLPVRRELLDLGWIPAASFRSSAGDTITFWDNGTYRMDGRRGAYTLETFPNVPWISGLRLDNGFMLHARYEDRCYRVEDLPALRSRDLQFSRQ